MKSGLRCTGIILLLLSFVSAQTIVHSPPRNVAAGSSLVIEAIVENVSVAVQEIKLYFRESGAASFQQEEMIEYMGVFQYTIPAEFVTDKGVEYIIVARMADESIVAFPETDPFNVPMYIATTTKSVKSVEPVAGQQAREIQGGNPSGAIILSPSEGEIIAAQEMYIAVSLFNTKNISTQKVKIEIDGKPIIQKPTITPDLITARPKQLSPGMHRITVTLYNNSGVAYTPLVWNCTVVKDVAAAKRVLKYKGQVIATANSEQYRGSVQNIQDIKTNIRGTYDWLEFYAKGTLTSLEDPTKQPKNRYAGGFSTRYFDLNFGDVNPMFNEFGLKGKRVRGLEAHLKLRYINLHFVNGEINRAVEGNISEHPDTTNEGLFVWNRSNYTFKRNLLGVRPYFGSGRYFQLGFSLLKIRDDTSSVIPSLKGISNDGLNSIVMSGEKPQDNIVIGTDMIIAADNKRVLWKNNLSLSLLNRDISDGPITLQELDTFLPGDSLIDDALTLGGTKLFTLSSLPITPEDIAWFFIINENLSPLSPIVPDTATNAIGLAQVLNMPSTAFKSEFKLNYFNNYIVMSYQRVGPEYVSLGNPYMQNDVQGMTVSDRIRLFKNKLLITLRYDQKRDNLNGTKSATTTTGNFNGGLTLNLGEGLPTLNFNTMQYTRKNDISRFDTSYTQSGDSVESYLVDNRENNMTIRQNFKISHRFVVAKISNDVNISYSASNRSDEIKDRLADYEFNTTSSQNTSVSWGFKPEKLPLKTTLSYSTIVNETITDTYEFQTLGIAMKLDIKKNYFQVNGGINQTEGGGSLDYTKSKIYGGGFIRFLDRHRINGNVSYTLLNDRLAGEKYNDYTINVFYTLTL